VVAHAGDGDDVLIVEGPTRVVRDGGEVGRIDAAYGQSTSTRSREPERRSPTTPPTTSTASNRGGS